MKYLNYIDNKDGSTTLEMSPKPFKKYYFKGAELYKVKEISGLNYLGHDIDAYYIDPLGNVERHGLFYVKDLEVK